jgi:hypothetical protein
VHISIGAKNVNGLLLNNVAPHRLPMVSFHNYDLSGPKPIRSILASE